MCSFTCYFITLCWSLCLAVASVSERLRSAALQTCRKNTCRLLSLKGVCLSIFRKLDYSLAASCCALFCTGSNLRAVKAVHLVWQSPNGMSGAMSARQCD